MQEQPPHLGEQLGVVIGHAVQHGAAECAPQLALPIDGAAAKGCEEAEVGCDGRLGQRQQRELLWAQRGCKVRNDPVPGAGMVPQRSSQPHTCFSFMRASPGRSPSSLRSFLREAGTLSLPFCTRLGLAATGLRAMEGSWGGTKGEKPCRAHPHRHPSPHPAAPRSPPGPAAPVVAVAPSRCPGSLRAHSALPGTVLTAAHSWPAAAFAAGGARPRSGRPAPVGCWLGQPQAPRWPLVWLLHPHPSHIAPPLPPPPSAPASPAPGGAQSH